MNHPLNATHAVARAGDSWAKYTNVFMGPTARQTQDGIELNRETSIQMVHETRASRMRARAYIGLDRIAIGDAK